MKTHAGAYLAESDWLENNLDSEDLRIIDCHYFFEIGADGTIRFDSGRTAWEASHIPNSCFLDLLTEASDQRTDLPFMMPPLSQFKDVLSRKGIGENSRVILYDRGEHIWACRLWWMLKAIGCDQASVLNGGWKKWQAEERPVTDTPCTVTPTTSMGGHPGPQAFVGKTDVFESLQEPSVKRVCCLEHPLFQQGHIPNSLNIPASTLIHPTDNTFLSVVELETLFEGQGLGKQDRIITYCGGAIAGSCGAFALTMAGYENVSVYDGSLDEWRRDPAMPIERG